MHCIAGHSSAFQNISQQYIKMGVGVWGQDMKVQHYDIPSYTQLTSKADSLVLFLLKIKVKCLFVKRSNAHWLCLRRMKDVEYSVKIWVNCRPHCYSTVRQRG